MYKCDICGAEFDEPHTHKEKFTDDGHSCYLYEKQCPICGSCHFEEKEEDYESV